jgi:hypothetical protein
MPAALHQRLFLLLLTSPPSGSTIRSNHLSKEERSSFGSVIIYYPPPLPGRSDLARKKVLLIDRCQATRDVRAAVLRSHGVEVHAAEEISAADFFGSPISMTS